jgi:hypothetical protein
MRFFTDQLRQRCRSDDDSVVAAAEQEWEAANERYEEHLRAFESRLPEHIRQFSDLLLHDALVRDIARRGDQLILVLLKDVPPRDVVILTYTLVGEPEIRRPSSAETQVMDFQFDELDFVDGPGGLTYVQEIVFGNGWELTLRFKDVRITLADAVYPTAEESACSNSNAIAMR